MSHRKPTETRVDKKIFRNTAVRTREINIAPKVSRGGIRL